MFIVVSITSSEIGNKIKFKSLRKDVEYIEFRSVWLMCTTLSTFARISKQV